MISNHHKKLHTLFTHTFFVIFLFLSMLTTQKPHSTSSFITSLTTIWCDHYTFLNQFQGFQITKLLVDYIERLYGRYEHLEETQRVPGTSLPLSRLCVLVWYDLLRRHEISLQLPLAIVLQLLSVRLLTPQGAKVEHETLAKKTFQESTKPPSGGDQMMDEEKEPTPSPSSHLCGPGCLVQCEAWKQYRKAMDETTRRRDTRGLFYEHQTSLDARLLTLFFRDWHAYRRILGSSPGIARLYHTTSIDNHLSRVRWAELADRPTRHQERRATTTSLYHVPFWTYVELDVIGHHQWPFLGIWASDYSVSVVDNVIQLASASDTVSAHTWKCLQASLHPYVLDARSTWSNPLRTHLQKNFLPQLQRWNRRMAQQKTAKVFLDQVIGFHEHPSDAKTALAFLLQHTAEEHSLFSPSAFESLSPLVKRAQVQGSELGLFQPGGGGRPAMEATIPPPSSSSSRMDRWRLGRDVVKDIQPENWVETFPMYLTHIDTNQPTLLTDTQSCKRGLEVIRGQISKWTDEFLPRYLIVYAKYSWVCQCELWVALSKRLMHIITATTTHSIEPPSWIPFIAQIEHQHLEMTALLAQWVPKVNVVVLELRDLIVEFHTKVMEVQSFYAWLGLMRHASNPTIAATDARRSWKDLLSGMSCALEKTLRHPPASFPPVASWMNYFQDVTSYRQADETFSNWLHSEATAIHASPQAWIQISAETPLQIAWNDAQLERWIQTHGSPFGARDVPFIEGDTHTQILRILDAWMESHKSQLASHPPIPLCQQLVLELLAPLRSAASWTNSPFYSLLSRTVICQALLEGVGGFTNLGGFTNPPTHPNLGGFTNPPIPPNLGTKHSVKVVV